MENTEQMSLLEIAVKLVEEKGLYNIKELIKDTLRAKGISEDNTDAAVQLYVDMTASSKFVYMGDDMWDLKAHQPLEAFDKDGSSFISKDEEYVPEDDEEEEFFDDDVEASDEEDEDEESKDDSYDEDSLDDEDDEEDKKSEDGDLESEDTERYSEDDYSEDDYSDDDEFNEDKYNDLMDDYEDMYDDK